MRRRVVIALGLILGCAPTAETDSDEEGTVSPGAVVEFDPSRSIVPLPNNLVVSPTTGKVNVPPQCNESATSQALREGVLNTLNGFGTWKSALQVTLSKAVDPDSLEGHVFLYRLKRGTAVTDVTTATPVPIVMVKGTALRTPNPYPTCGTPGAVNALTIVPAAPLTDESTYVVGITKGLTVEDDTTGSTTGTEFMPSGVWALVRRDTTPVDLTVSASGEVTVKTNLTPLDPTDDEDLASLKGIQQLWGYHSQFLPFLTAAIGKTVNGSPAQPLAREDLLLAWSFNTQTVQSPLDKTVAGSPASLVATVGPNAPLVTLDYSANPAPAVVNAVLCGALGQPANCTLFCDLDGAPTEAGKLPCYQVGAIKKGAFASPDFQVRMPNPGQALDASLNKPVPGPWANPVTPPQVDVDPTDGDVDAGQVPFLAFLPTIAAPTDGYPVVIFGHGVTRSAGDLFTIASQLADQGFASIAMDAVAHGNRAVQVYPGAACATAGDSTTTPSPTVSPQCFAPFLSSNLVVTRDNIRQTVIDELKLIEVVKGCSGTTPPASCAGLNFDPTRISFLAQSLGALVGNMTVAASSDIKAAVLNVGGVSWVDVFTETQRLSLRCPIIDSLIDAGVLQGEKSTSTTGAPLCAGDTWQTHPGYLQFANTARWVLDPADGANFAPFWLAPSSTSVLIQDVENDDLVSATSTGTLARLIGLNSPVAASVNTGVAMPTSAVMTSDRAYVHYSTTATGGNNKYVHGSLLVPADLSAQAKGGTAQMQTDAITFIVVNTP